MLGSQVLEGSLVLAEAGRIKESQRLGDANLCLRRSALELAASDDNQAWHGPLASICASGLNLQATVLRAAGFFAPTKLSTAAPVVAETANAE